MGEPIVPDFDYTSRERTQHAIEGITRERINCVGNTIQRGIPVQFEIERSDLYTALHETELFVRCRVTAQDGQTAVANNGTATVKNNLFHTMWKTIEIRLNGNEAETVSDYPYRAYLQTLTEFDEDVLKKRGKLIGWSKDLAGQMDVMSGAANSANTGALPRSQVGSHVHALIGKLFTDLMHQGRSIPPYTKISITLTPAADAFVLGGVAADDQILTILDAHLLVTRQRVAKPLSLVHKNLWAKSVPRLHTRQVRISKHIIPGGVAEAMLQSLFNAPAGVAHLPDRFLVGFVPNASVVGARAANPFNFGSHNISSLEAKHGDRTLAHYELAWGNTTGYIKAYYELLKEFGAHDEFNHTLNITPDEFANGYALFPFRIVPRTLGGASLGEPAVGNVTLDIKFSQAPVAPLTCLVFCEYRGHYDILPPATAGPIM
jgi:hypothetical protein